MLGPDEAAKVNRNKDIPAHEAIIVTDKEKSQTGENGYGCEEEPAFEERHRSLLCLYVRSRTVGFDTPSFRRGKDRNV